MWVSSPRSAAPLPSPGWSQASPQPSDSYLRLPHPPPAASLMPQVSDPSSLSLGVIRDIAEDGTLASSLSSELGAATAPTVSRVTIANAVFAATPLPVSPLPSLRSPPAPVLPPAGGVVPSPVLNPSTATIPPQPDHTPSAPTLLLDLAPPADTSQLGRVLPPMPAPTQAILTAEGGGPGMILVTVSGVFVILLLCGAWRFGYFSSTSKTPIQPTPEATNASLVDHRLLEGVAMAPVSTPQIHGPPAIAPQDTTQLQLHKVSMNQHPHMQSHDHHKEASESSIFSHPAMLPAPDAPIADSHAKHMGAGHGTHAQHHGDHHRGDAHTDHAPDQHPHMQSHDHHKEASESSIFSHPAMLPAPDAPIADSHDAHTDHAPDQHPHMQSHDHHKEASESSIFSHPAMLPAPDAPIADSHAKHMGAGHRTHAQHHGDHHRGDAHTNHAPDQHPHMQSHNHHMEASESSIFSHPAMLPAPDAPIADSHAKHMGVGHGTHAHHHHDHTQIPHTIGRHRGRPEAVFRL